MAIHEKLKAKIVNKEEMDRVTADPYLYRAKRLPIFGMSRTPPWWLLREMLRLDHGIYEITDVLAAINEAYPYVCAHVSTEDRTMVSYTPDATCGENDRQVRLSPGKLIKRLYPWAPDEVVQEKVAEHLAELSNDIEWVVGDDIAAAYDDGIGSCMSNKEWDTGVHPAKFYNAPNIKLAVLRDPETKKVTARALVYEASEKDKRYIRQYGDMKLRKRLERLGYKAGAWHGASFNVIKLDENKYVAPYLDGCGGAGSMEVSAVAMLDGKIVSIPRDTLTKLTSINPSCVASLTNTCGWVLLQDQSTEQFMVTAADTGNRINVLTDAHHRVYTTPTDSVIYEEEPNEDTVHYAHVIMNGRLQRVFALKTIPHFTHRSAIYLETDATREHVGYRRLSPLYYPTDSQWGFDRYKLVKTADDQYIKVEDAVTVLVTVRGSLSTTYHHKSAIKPEWVKVHSTHKGKAEYASSASMVVTTTSGRKVVPQHHDVVQLWDGAWTFRRNASGDRMWGSTIWWESKGPKPNLAYNSPITQKMVSQHLEAVERDYELTGQGLGVVILQAMTNAGVYSVRSNGQVFYVSDWLRFQNPDARDSFTPHYANLTPAQVLELVRTSIKAYDRFGVKAFLYYYDMYMAEATAVEAPHKLEEVVAAMPAQVQVQAPESVEFVESSMQWVTTEVSTSFTTTL